MSWRVNRQTNTGVLHTEYASTLNAHSDASTHLHDAKEILAFRDIAKDGESAIEQV